MEERKGKRTSMRKRKEEKRVEKWKKEEGMVRRKMVVNGGRK